MKKNLILYETHYGIAKRCAEIIALICGNAKVCDANKVNIQLDLYDNVIFVVGFHGTNTAESIKKFIKDNNQILKGKCISYVGVGLSKHGSENYLKTLENSLGRRVDYEGFVHGQIRVNKLTEEDKSILKVFLEQQNMKLIDIGKFNESEACNVGEKLSNVINKCVKEMKKEDLKKEIEKFVSTHKTCALATGNSKFIRCTPIEYIYRNNDFYFITEGGKKFKGIIENGNAAVAIYNEYSGFNSLKGLQAEGIIELLEIGCNEYKEVMKIRGVNKAFLEKSPINMNIVKLKVNKYEFLNSDFKNLGCDAKQTYLVN